MEFWCEGESSSEDEAAYDEDDENAENNWRNDYPDDDPMYFERLYLDDNYSSDDDGECYVAGWVTVKPFNLAALKVGDFACKIILAPFILAN